VITPDLSVAALQLPVGRDHAKEGAPKSAGDAVVTPVCRALAKRMGHGALASLPPKAATTTGVTEGDGVPEGVLAPEPEGELVGVGVTLGVDGPLAPDDKELVGDVVGDVDVLGETVAEGDAEGATSAYSVPLSENTTVLPASMGEPVMGCAAGVV
jgi:hypothetical protein